MGGLNAILERKKVFLSKIENNEIKKVTELVLNWKFKIKYTYKNNKISPYFDNILSNLYLKVCPLFFLFQENMELR